MALSAVTITCAGTFQYPSVWVILQYVDSTARTNDVGKVGEK